MRCTWVALLLPLASGRRLSHGRPPPPPPFPPAGPPLPEAPPAPPSLPAPPIPPPLPPLAPDSLLVLDVDQLVAAVRHSSVGTVVIAPGRYVLPATLRIDRVVNLVSLEPGAAILDGQSSFRVIELNMSAIPWSATATILIDGLVITRGNARSDLRAGHGGGLAYSDDYLSGMQGGPLNVTISRCHFVHNVAQIGAAIYYNPGQIAKSPTVQDFRISDCFFTNNEAGQYAGAVELVAAGVNVLIERTVFRGNIAPAGMSTAFTTWNLASGLVVGCTFIARSAEEVFVQVCACKCARTLRSHLMLACGCDGCR